MNEKNQKDKQEERPIFDLTTAEKAQVIALFNMEAFLDIMKQAIDFQKIELNAVIKKRLDFKDTKEYLYSIGIEDMYKGRIYVHKQERKPEAKPVEYPDSSSTKKETVKN